MTSRQKLVLAGSFVTLALALKGTSIFTNIAGTITTIFGSALGAVKNVESGIGNVVSGGDGGQFVDANSTEVE